MFSVLWFTQFNIQHQNMHTYEFRILADIENHKIDAQEINLRL